jgi:hypothetical protein
MGVPELRRGDLPRAERSAAEANHGRVYSWPSEIASPLVDHRRLARTGEGVSSPGE